MDLEEKELKQLENEISIIVIGRQSGKSISTTTYWLNELKKDAIIKNDIDTIRWVNDKLEKLNELFFLRRIK